jgi:hypothetical protein
LLNAAGTALQLKAQVVSQGLRLVWMRLTVVLRLTQHAGHSSGCNNNSKSCSVQLVPRRLDVVPLLA